MHSQPQRVSLLQVGPSPDCAESLAAVFAVWQDFQRNIDLPIRCEQLEFARMKSEPLIASTTVPPNETKCFITVSANFLGLPPIEQRLTLLHETIHVRFLCGELAKENVESHRRFDAADAQIAHPALFDRLLRATFISNFIHEIVAERYLVLEYPHLARERALSMYRQRRNLEALLFDLAGCVRVCQAFYECLRCDLLVGLLGDSSETQDLLNVIQGLEHDMRSTACKVTFKEELFALRETLLHAELSPVRYNSKAYEKLYALTSQCPLGSQQADIHER